MNYHTIITTNHMPAYNSTVTFDFSSVDSMPQNEDYYSNIDKNTIIYAFNDTVLVFFIFKFRHIRLNFEPTLNNELFVSTDIQMNCVAVVLR